MMKKNILRKFGFQHDQQGIINRYLRETEGWNVHLNNCKNFILRASESKTKGTAVILGSGWLLDVPVEKLSKNFERVILVDIVHPRQVEHKVKKFKNVDFIKSDISGFIMPVYEHIRNFKKNNIKKNLIEIEPLFSHFGLNDINHADFVVSLNLLNQLDILICDYIIKFKIYNEIELLEFRKLIQKKHIQWLPKTKTCLISDYLELNLDDKNELIREKKLVHIDLPLNNNTKRWDWEFDQQKTYHREFKTIFKVIATNF